MTDCQIESLRGSNTCGIPNCTSTTTLNNCNTAGEIFQKSDLKYYDTSDYKCCGITIGGLIAAVVVPSCVALKIGMCIWHVWKTNKDREEKKNVKFK